MATPGFPDRIGNGFSLAGDGLEVGRKKGSVYVSRSKSKGCSSGSRVFSCTGSHTGLLKRRYLQPMSRYPSCPKFPLLPHRINAPSLQFFFVLPDRAVPALVYPGLGLADRLLILGVVFENSPISTSQWAQPLLR